ncbi:MAG: hypothetical protein EP319_18445 [Deltaproteobacteria bacterium]|jgi:c-di-AMP phosphodiesterase-like protein|nr:MAG: hypothetical protein EP319_18445 [Deltaproteobacteria bacterium]
MKKLFSLILLVTLCACSTTKDGKVVIDTKKVDNTVEDATQKIKKRKDYCSPLDKSLGKCE